MVSEQPVVLLVDDQAVNLRLLGSLLQDEYRVLIASNGPRALELANGSLRPDIILLDIMMPEMDGYEVCRRLLSNPATAEIPIIFVSAQDQEHDQQLGFELGAVDFITKPFSPLLLKLRLQNQLNLRRKTQELEQSKAELARSNADLEQFAYAVSHDLRQPLRMVSSYLGLLSRSLGDQLTQDQTTFIEFARDGARRMDEMILSLLAYSRVGRVGADKAMLDTRTALNEALHFLEPEIQSTQAQVEVQGEWPELYARADEITRLFQNLIGNALKYREQGAIPRVEVLSQVVSDQWQVRVTDQGIGIDAEQSSRLFQVFSRLHSRKQYDGYGVGLALCRKIVEHHQGTIGVESQGVGKGASFWFHLPLCPHS